jgi:hypothetical protein
MWSQTDSALEAYGPSIAAVIISGIIIGTLDGFSKTSSALQAIFMMCWLYFGHRVTHTLFTEKEFSGFLTTHVFLHHQKYGNLPRWLDLTIEFAIDMFSVAGILIIFQYLFNLHIFSTPLLIFVALIYSCGHIFLHSVVGSEWHRGHHKFTFCNYDPEFLDTLFKTRCDESTPYNIMTPELLISFPILLSVLLGMSYFKKSTS